MIEGIVYADRFIDDPEQLFHHLKSAISWDERMQARKTASYGKAYNYSQISYPFREFIPELEKLNLQLEKEIGFRPNNCLLNYYLDGKSKMGFHSDQTDILEENTGVAIISVGETRILRFRSIADPGVVVDYSLAPGSLIYMTQEIQENWHHAIPKSHTDNGRISITFRKIR
jgi:alkylated DNA repair dioxygenase AlkB